MSRAKWLLARARGYAPPIPPVSGKIYPGPDWTGTAGGEVPTFPSTPRAPIMGHSFSRMLTVTGDMQVCVAAGCMGGMARVEARCQGRTVTQTAPKWMVGTTPNGQPFVEYGFVFDIDAAAALAIATGFANLYFVGVPNDPTFENGVIGPISLNFRPTEFDLEIPIAVTPGFEGATYSGATAMAQAIGYQRSNPNTLCHIVLIEDAVEYDWPFLSGAVYAGAHKMVIRAAPGVSATLGNGTTAGGFANRFNNYEIRGSGVKLVVNRMSNTLTGAIQLNDGGLCHLNGVEITGGEEDLAHGLSGSGASMLRYNRPYNDSWMKTPSASTVYYEVTHCNIHDMPAYCLTGFYTSFNNTIDLVSGTAFENGRNYCGWNVVSRIGGIIPDWRTYKAALTIMKAGNNWIEKIGLNGNAGALALYEDDGNTFQASQAGTTLTVSSVAGAVNLTVGTYIMGAGVTSGTRITALGTGSGGVGTYTVSTNKTVAATTMRAPTHVMALTRVFPTNTKVPDVAAEINANWTGCTAEALSTNNRDATYFVLNGGTPAQGIAPQAFSGSITLYTIIDTHTDVWANAVPTTNYIMEFNKVPEVITSGTLSLDDSGVSHSRVLARNNIVDDVSAAEGEFPQDGRFQGLSRHILFLNNTWAAIGQQFNSTFVGDETCLFKRSALQKLAYALAPGESESPDIVIDGIVVTGNIALPSVATDLCKVLNNPGLTTLYEAPSNVDLEVGFCPIAGGPLQLADSTYAAARLPTALHTEANRGWNLTDSGY